MTISQIVRRLGLLLVPSLLLYGVTLVPDAGANYRFSHSGTRWAGGDGSYPVRLPTGEIVWIFGDSMIRNPDGSLRMVHGSMMLEYSDGSLQLIPPGESLLEPQTPGTIVWPASGFIENGRLQIFGEEIVVNGPSDFHSTGRRFLYAFSLPDLQRVDAPYEVYSGNISWGHATAISGSYVYVYGNREIDGFTNLTYLARFQIGGSHGFWQFWDGHQFQGALFSSAPLKGPGGADQVAKIASSIRLADGRWGAFTIDPFGSTVDIRYAAYPWGPWSARKTAYTLPASDNGKSYLPRAIRSGIRIRVAYSVPVPTSPIGVRFLKT